MDSDNNYTELNHSDSNPEHQVVGKEIRKKYLINKLNFINFQDGTVLVNFKHIKYKHTVSHRARPQPCLGEELKCFWVETGKISQRLTSYKFHEVIIPNGKKIISVKSNEINIDDTGIHLVLPDTCWEFSPRKMRRHYCKGIKVQLIQNSASFYGVLIDFTTESFRVDITANPPSAENARTSG